jgi:hypothetical protein
MGRSLAPNELHAAALCRLSFEGQQPKWHTFAIGLGRIFYSAAFGGTSFAWSLAPDVKELNWDLPYQLQTSAK